MIGQMLYLEAEANRIRATGIGCFLDVPVHRVFGLKNRHYQSFYHFTMGGTVEDNRLEILPTNLSKAWNSHLSDRYWLLYNDANIQ